jgi:hypothetical protein
MQSRAGVMALAQSLVEYAEDLVTTSAIVYQDRGVGIAERSQE